MGNVRLEATRQSANQRDLHADADADETICVAVVSAAGADNSRKWSHVHRGARSRIARRPHARPIEMIKQAQLRQVGRERIAVAADGIDSDLGLERNVVLDEESDTERVGWNIYPCHRIVAQAD